MPGGYLEDDIDRKRASWWKVVLFSIGSMIPLFWLWNRTDFPDSLGIHIAAHGKTGLLENWYYSYLLIERHRPLDIVTFAYMWALALGLVMYAALPWLKARRAKEAAAANLNPSSDPDAE